MRAVDTKFCFLNFVLGRGQGAAIKSQRNKHKRCAQGKNQNKKLNANGHRFHSLGY